MSAETKFNIQHFEIFFLFFPENKNLFFFFFFGGGGGGGVMEDINFSSPAELV